MRINSIQSCARKLHQESQCTGQPADWRKGAPAWKGLIISHTSQPLICFLVFHFYWVRYMDDCLRVLYEKLFGSFFQSVLSYILAH